MPRNNTPMDLPCSFSQDHRCVLTGRKQTIHSPWQPEKYRRPPIEQPPWLHWSACCILTCRILVPPRLAQASLQAGKYTCIIFILWFEMVAQKPPDWSKSTLKIEFVCKIILASEAGFDRLRDGKMLGKRRILIHTASVVEIGCTRGSENWFDLLGIWYLISNSQAKASHTAG